MIFVTGCSLYNFDNLKYRLIILILMSVSKTHSFLIIMLLLINCNTLFFVIIGEANAVSRGFDNLLDLFQLYEDCFNGIDDDGDSLIDRADVFDC
jgi:hypothetical protein